MAKPEGWRLNIDSYPVKEVVQTRFQDLDINGHINNVAFAALFETGRVKLNIRESALNAKREGGERKMVVSVAINYLAEGHFPGEVIVASGFGPVGNSSWAIAQAIFQDGRCLATCDSVIVSRMGDGPNPVSAALRADLEALAAKPVS